MKTDLQKAQEWLETCQGKVDQYGVDAIISRIDANAAAATHRN